MLNQPLARQLGYKGDFSIYRINSASFTNNSPFWVKQSQHPHISRANIPNIHKFDYIKYGQIFGFELTRYLELVDGYLLYFDDQNGKNYKGYARIDDKYIYYFKGDGRNVLYLTNGNEGVAFRFRNDAFMQNAYSKILKRVIQLSYKNKYEVVKLLGEGTFSKVYLAKKMANETKYAVKVVPKIDRDGNSTKRIVEEQRKILINIESPLLSKMVQFFEEEEQFVFVLQLLEGRDLNCLFKQYYKLTVQQSKQILKGALQCLAEIHRHNIIHRDMKPHNLFINLEQKSVRLIDFGLSLLYDKNTDINKYIRCGTMGYIAPEVINSAQNHRIRYDTKSDIYGLGIIAHMTLMGTNPLRGKNYKETVERNLHGKVQLDKEAIEAKYGPECYDFMASLLHNDPKKRPTAEQALKSGFFLASEIKNASLENTLETSLVLKGLGDLAENEGKSMEKITSRIYSPTKYSKDASDTKKTASNSLEAYKLVGKEAN